MDILFIEDENNARIALKLLLENEHHRVDEAANADEALERLQEKDYGLIILDIMFPGGSLLKEVPFRETGKEFLLRLRAGSLPDLKVSKDVAVVALTAVTDMDVIQPIEKMVKKILYKPLDPLDALVESFGTGKLAYGSNWPVCEKYADYATAFSVPRAYFNALGSEVADAVFRKNALACYRCVESRATA